MDRQGERWSIEEEKLIYDRFLAKTSAEDVAKEVNRKAGGIRARWRKLGLINKNGRPINPAPPFQPVADLDSKPVKAGKPKNQILDQSIETDIRFSPTRLREDGYIGMRLANCLINMDIEDVRQAFSWSDVAFMRYQNLGRKTLNEWKEFKNAFAKNAIVPKQEKTYEDKDSNNDELVVEEWLLESEEAADRLIELINEEISFVNVKNPRTADILRLRLGIGLEEGEPLTLEKVGNQYGVSRERIRQIENKALRILTTRLKRADNYNTILIRNTVIFLFSEKEGVSLRRIIEFCSEYYDWRARDKIANLLSISGSLFESYRVAKPKIEQGGRTLRGEYREKAKQKYSAERAEKKWIPIQEQVIWPSNVQKFDGPIDEFSTAKREINEESNGTTGTFQSDKCHREVSFESYEEFRVFQISERCTKIVWYQEQPCIIPYKINDKDCSYCPDLAVVTNEGKGIVIEVKPRFHMLRKATVRKAIEAITYLHKKGIGYALVDSRGNSIRTQAQHPFDKELEHVVIQQINENGSVEYKELKKHYKFTSPQLSALIINNNFSYEWGKIQRLPEGLSFSPLKKAS